VAVWEKKKESEAVMPERVKPDWFSLGEQATPETMRRIAFSVANLDLPLQVKNLPMLAHWFFLDSLFMSNQANRDGMHANALALMRQCVEAISIFEIGLCRHPDAVSILSKWEKDQASPGELRKWLSENVWPQYGTGLWNESWVAFMSQLARAIQPYAHYSALLSQWQARLHNPLASASQLLI
jgi:hypothetical protein